MKTSLRSILCLSAFLLAAFALHAQDLSKYRSFSLGANLASVMKQTNLKTADVVVTHPGPPLFQELTWWPPNLPGTSFESDSVEQVLFSFYSGQLYKMTVTYDQASTEGLTAADMIKSISATYGPPTTALPEGVPPEAEKYDAKEYLVVAWEDPQYSFHLVRSAFTDRLGLVICAKRLNAEADLDIAVAVKREAQEGPQKDADRQKQEATDLETKRLKNKKAFRP